MRISSPVILIYQTISMLKLFLEKESEFARYTTNADEIFNFFDFFKELIIDKVFVASNS